MLAGILLRLIVEVNNNMSYGAAGCFLELDLRKRAEGAKINTILHFGQY